MNQKKKIGGRRKTQGIGSKKWILTSRSKPHILNNEQYCNPI